MLCAQTASALLAAKQKADPKGWQDFQETVHALKNQRTRTQREAEDLQASLFAADTALRLQKEGAVGEPLLHSRHNKNAQCALLRTIGLKSPS